MCHITDRKEEEEEENIESIEKTSKPEKNILPMKVFHFTKFFFSKYKHR